MSSLYQLYTLTVHILNLLIKKDNLFLSLNHSHSISRNRIGKQIA